MKKFIFIFGGIRSGKSSYAVQLAKKLSKKAAFIATASASDEEMKKRIKLHKSSRPKFWKTIEENENVAEVVERLIVGYDVVIIDCLGLLISNLMYKGITDSQITKKIKILAQVISKKKQNIILVSNDVGSSLVPDNPLGRRFADLVGFGNQIMAKNADEVIFMQAGIPVKIKLPLSPLLGKEGIKGW
ncbi:MAG: bifunctional adenosylcobinamide kinase/adenosylcobinamide-phosphate guanylyltransferase [bacterium]|nr:bifunctional adenosylcobinamide kinase/adenosylcobinamide-phosphate guanylyltransferase [bacterium]